MSLNVYLTGEKTTVLCTCPLCGDEHTHEATEEFYSDGITHNLNVMAEKAGIYQCLWCPEDIGISKASQLITPLATGLGKLEQSRDYFERFNPPNNYGSYDELVTWVRRYLAACKTWPDATVTVDK